MPLDVRNSREVDELVQREAPDRIFHFAGQAFVLPSWEDPAGTFETNLTGTLNLLESVRKHRPSARVAFAGSGTEYGDSDRVPTPESASLRPTSPYASSKAAADLLCYQYHRSFGLHTIRFRIFGTTGPGKRGDSINDFASQIAAAEKLGKPSSIKVGNLFTSRDVTDVRDAVRAMAILMERGRPGEAYNVGSGRPRVVGDTLQRMVALSRVPVTPETDRTRVRLVDEPVHLADVSRLMELGWVPEIPFERTLQDVLDYWRARDVANQSPGRES